MPAQRSIVICGGAFAGLALALALRQGLGPDIPVIVADPALASRPSRDPRATAIVAACRRLFEALGVWGEISAGAQPITDMVVLSISGSFRGALKRRTRNLVPKPLDPGFVLARAPRCAIAHPE